jgi:hypothetical protein
MRTHDSVPPVSQERDDAYRAIGRYVTEFSQLIRVMRVAVAEYVAGDPTQMDIPEMMLGDQTARPITNVFFGVCRMVGNLDATESNVESKLRQEVLALTEERNDYAHGDWIVGEAGFILPATLPATFLASDPKLVRIRAARTVGTPRKTLSISIADLDAKTDNVQRMLQCVHEFGRLALGLPVRRDDDGKQVMSRGEYRVRDVLVVEGGDKKAGKARVEPNGPRARELSWDYGY